MISLAVIALNEEQSIEKLLKTSQYHVDEIVVVDGGSIDSTVEICKNYNVKIIYNEWDYNFSKQRNIAIKNCSNDWIVSLDCDEYMEPSSWNNLESIISDDFDCFVLRTKTYDVNQKYKKLRCQEYHKRVFKKYCKFHGCVHESISGYKNKMKIKDGVEIIHEKRNQEKSDFLYYFMEPWKYPQLLEQDKTMRNLINKIGIKNWKCSKKFIKKIKDDYYSSNDFLVV